MKSLISLLLVFVMVMLAGCVHNQNRKAFQSSTLKTQHRATPVT